MAHMATSLKLKRNAQLESFLKRTLPSQLYEDIRYYEGCVVKAPAEEVVFRFVILTSEQILLADPPRRGRKLHVKEALRIEEIARIQVDHNTRATFLTSPVQDTCQHIRVFHGAKASNALVPNTSSRLLGRDGLPWRPSCSELSWTRHTSESSTPNSFSSARRRRRDAHGKKEQLRETDSDSCSVRDETGARCQLIFDEIRENLRLSQNASPSNRKESQDLSFEPVIAMNKEFAKTTEDLLVRDCPDGWVHDDTRGSMRSLRALLGRVRLAKPRIPRSWSSMDQHKPEVEGATHNRSASSLDTSKLPAPLSSEPASSELSLYVVQKSSSLHNLLQCFWWKSLILATEGLECKRKTTKMTDEQAMEVMFNEVVKRLPHLHCPLKRVEATLLRQLKAALETSASMKAMFWKNQRVYCTVVEKLEVCLHFPGDQADQRVEELTSAALLLHTLCAALTASDCVREKLQMFQYDKCSGMTRLLSVVLLQPKLRHQCNAICARMLDKYSHFVSGAWRNLPEAQLISSLAEITNTCTAVVYELILTADQLGPAGSSPPLLAQILDGTALETYLHRSITQLLGFLCYHSSSPLRPTYVVLVYKHLYVLQCLMENIGEILEYVQMHFEEEIKYYIKWKQISPIVPDNYPIKPLLEAVVVRVRQLVLLRS